MENTPVNFREIRFNRNTKVNYKDGNPIINTIFQKYDKDNSGDFSDEEWTNYQQQLKQLEERKAEIDKLRENINNNVVAHYSHNVDKLNKKIEKLEQKQAELISQNNFQKLMEFEKLHNVSREGYKDKSELPEKAKEYDISSFQMGIFNEKENSFTGEIYTKGYLYGFENLTKEEQTEYLNLLKDTVKTNEQIKKYEEKISELNDEIDKNLALKDLAQNGMVKKVGSSEYENNAYSQYSAIRNESNPFYKQIKELETKYSKIRLKGSPTADDKRLMEQYKIQIEQLKQASENWSISDAPKGKGLEKSDGFKLTDLSEQLTYKNQSSTDNEIKSNVQTLTDNHTLGVGYNNQNWSVNTNFTKGETYTLNSTSPDSTTDTVHTYNAYLNASYGRQDMSLSTTSNINADNTSVYYSQSINAKYKKLGLNVENSLNVNKFEIPDESGNIIENSVKSNSTNVKLSYDTGKFTNSAGVSFAPEGTNILANSSANFSIQSGNSFWNLNPSSDFTYNTETETFTANPSFGANYSYNSKDLRANVMLNNNLSITAVPEMATQFSNSLNLNAGLTYKDISLNGKYNNYYTTSSKTNTFGAEVSYNNTKAGRFAFEYSRQNMKGETSFSKTDQILFTYSAPVETITNWVKKK